jgi:hypothetical protein
LDYLAFSPTFGDVRPHPFTFGSRDAVAKLWPAAGVAMTASQSATPAFADASETALDQPLPELPPGKKYGPRIGGWGPYSIIDDVAVARDQAAERGSVNS